MIPSLPHWTWSSVAGEVTLLPPEGPRAGVIRYRDRLRPLDRASRLVAAVEDRELEIVASAPPEERVTAEGEHAAWVVEEARRAGRPARRFIGLVFGDDFYARLVATVYELEQAARFATVAAALLAGDAQQLGVRRRRFRYAPPRGWLGRRLDLFHEEWTPPEHPRDPTRILVCPATPLAGADPVAAGLAAVAAEPLRDFAPEVQLGPSALGAVAGLAAQHVQLSGRRGGLPLLRDVLLLADERFAYPLAIDSPAPDGARNRARLEALAATVRAVPRPEITLPATGALDHWG